MGKFRKWFFKYWLPCRKVDLNKNNLKQDNEFGDFGPSACDKGAEEDLLQILIPRNKFEEFEKLGPEGNVLSLQDYMYLYKYCTEVGTTPGPGYQYKVFRFKADDTLVILEGWVPRSESNIWKWPD